MPELWIGLADDGRFKSCRESRDHGFSDPKDFQSAVLRAGSAKKAAKELNLQNKESSLSLTSDVCRLFRSKGLVVGRN